MTARRPWALPLVPLYWAGLRFKDALRALGLLRTHGLRWPVVSVGSLSAGGAGKTPVVIALARLLQSNGRGVDVLSRGYGRFHREAARVALVDLTVPDPAARFGDEPALMAAALPGLPVWVGADRYAAGASAESDSSSVGIHLLDDGFQHRRLARAFDIVLVTAQDLDDPLLPAGNRREPLSALRRVGAIVLREEERAALEPSLVRWCRPGTPLWYIRRSLVVPESLDHSFPLISFAGIARPEGFLHMLRSCGLRVIDSVQFPDHHRYNAEDMRHLVQRLQSKNAGAFITTEKDAVKITPELRSLLEAAGPLHLAGLRVDFAQPAPILAELEVRCR